MKILITGSTAPQVPSRASGESPTFVGLLNKALTTAGHDVTWAEPSVTMDKEFLNEFDSVLVGLAPPTSTSAHRIYGALSVYQNAHDLGKAAIILDAPDPRKVWAGVRAVYKRPETLVKDFYSKRREYRHTSDEQTLARLHTSIDTLYTQQWPTTLFPAFPWMTERSVTVDVPNASGTVVGINLDSGLLADVEVDYRDRSGKYWVSDAVSAPWTVGIAKTVKYDIIAATGKDLRPADVRARLHGSVGCLIGVYRNGAPWWSPTLMRALTCCTPVVTDWRLSSMLGQSWSTLAHSVEELDRQERAHLASNQLDAYISAIPTWEVSSQIASAALVRGR